MRSTIPKSPFSTYGSQTDKPFARSPKFNTLKHETIILSSNLQRNNVATLTNNSTFHKHEILNFCTRAVHPKLPDLRLIVGMCAHYMYPLVCPPICLLTPTWSLSLHLLLPTCCAVKNRKLPTCVVVGFCPSTPAAQLLLGNEIETYVHCHGAVRNKAAMAPWKTL